MLKTYDVVTILNRMESNHQRLQQELTGIHIQVFIVSYAKQQW